MKAKLIIICWLLSLMLMATDNLLQASIAFCFFGISSWLIKRYKDEVKKGVERFENRIDKLINR